MYSQKILFLWRNSLTEPKRPHNNCELVILAGILFDILTLRWCPPQTGWELAPVHLVAQGGSVKNKEGEGLHLELKERETQIGNFCKCWCQNDTLLSKASFRNCIMGPVPHISCLWTWLYQADLYMDWNNPLGSSRFTQLILGVKGLTDL